MEGKKVASDVQKNVVDVYSAQVGALETRAKLYTAQVDGAKAEAEIERLKMENYKISTDAYVARLEGEKAKYSIYATEVEAEKAKIMAFSEQVKAFLAEAETIKLGNDGKNQELNAKIASNSAYIDKYKADVGAYDSVIKEIAQQHDVAIKEFDANTSRMTAESRVIESKNNLLLKGIDAELEGQRLLLDSEKAQIDAIKTGYEALLELEGNTRMGIYNASAQLMASAMSSVSAQASISDAASTSARGSYSLNNNLTEQHTFSV